MQAAAIRASMLFAPAVAAPAVVAGARAEVAAGSVAARAVLRNPLGLHARPAALLARAIADSGDRVTVDGVEGASVLELMRLGATGGRELTLVASGPGAAVTLAKVVAMVEGGFGEV